jgi:zinc transport system substrate-binding protein
MECRTRQLGSLGPARISLCLAAVLGLALPLLLLIACRPAPPSGTPESQPAAAPETASGDRLRVFVSIPPQAYFVHRVGGDRVQVDVLVGPGQNPHSYEATPGQVTSLAKARVFFRIGMPFEAGLLPRLHTAFKHLEIVDARQGVPLRSMEEHEDLEGHAGQTAHHEEEGDDPHIWLNPRLVKIQAQMIADTLARLDPAHKEEYRRNLAAFGADLDALDARLAAVLAPLRGKNLFVYHPAFGYFAEAYGLHQVPVEIGGKEPTAQDMTELIRRARQDNVRVIFVQPQFSTRSAEIIARQIHGAVVPLDDLAPDYMKSMESMAEQVRQALSGPESGAMPGRSAGMPAPSATAPKQPSVQP